MLQNCPKLTHHALARDGVSREVPCSALKGETVPDSLPATRETVPDSLPATPKSPPTRRVPPRGLTGKDPDAGRDWGQEEKGMAEDEMAGWHH